MSQAVTFLVVSCDKYSDAWRLYFTLLWKHWPDCPYQICLGSNRERFQDGRVTNVLVGDDTDWSSSLIRMLDQINTKYVILCLEDYFLLKRIDTNAIKMCVNKIDRNDGVYLLMSKVPRGRQPNCKIPGFVELMPGETYRTSLNVAIWRTTALRDLARPGESAWDFEIEGSRRSMRSTSGFYANQENLYHLGDFSHIRRGVWLRPCLKLASDVRVPLDLERRPVMTRLEHCSLLAQQLKARMRALLSKSGKNR